MADKTIREISTGHATVDGAGVHLVRVLGNSTVESFDPFLMLDSFDSRNPEDYIKGFPFHPHRGIETITYLIEGEIDHKDSLGNAGIIKGGQSQWMTAGSGIMHQEMPQASERMLGIQLWLNLPRSEKMAEPRYFDITPAMVGVKETGAGTLRVISGEFEDAKGVDPYHIKATIYDMDLDEGTHITLPVKKQDRAFVFLIEGDAVIDGRTVAEKSAVVFSDEGDTITISAPAGKKSRFIYCAGKPLGEPIAWGGPIVMNTREELQEAFDELRRETFIKHKPAGI